MILVWGSIDKLRNWYPYALKFGIKRKVAMLYKAGLILACIIILSACSRDSDPKQNAAAATQTVPEEAKKEDEGLKIEVPVKIFGLALDQKLEKKLPVCTFQEIGDAKRVCWVDKPFKGLLGTLQFPSNTLPSWAAYSSIQLKLNPDGSPGRIEVQGRSDCHRKFLETVTSIRLKFGPPDSISDSSEQYPKAAWEKDEVRIVTSVINDELCLTKFTSPKAWAAQVEHINQMKKKEASRPLTP